MGIFGGKSPEALAVEATFRENEAKVAAEERAKEAERKALLGRAEGGRYRLLCGYANDAHAAAELSVAASEMAGYDVIAMSQSGRIDRNVCLLLEKRATVVERQGP